ncbi:MAG: hypothetical protein JNK37_13165 [Verrucomicrobiales bacterium]|nr:hypothetical protein [Verrucomicrobiales bacterium]
MAFFKRIEVWVLLLLSVGAIVWVLWSEQVQDREEDEAPAPAASHEAASTAAGRFAIDGRWLSREGEHLILTVRVKRQAAGEAIPLDDDCSRLLTEAGDSVSRFFLPFDAAAVLAGESGAFTDLRYWLPVGQADGRLWLEIDGERLPAKEIAGWPDDLPEGTEVAVQGGDWQR